MSYFFKNCRVAIPHLCWCFLEINRKKKIHCLHFSEKPQCSNKRMRKLQFTLNGFSTSNIQSTPGWADFNLLSRHFLAIKTESRICLSNTKAF